MEPIFFPDTIDEFLFEYLEPELKVLHDLRDSAVRLGGTKHFGLRPFRINSMLEQRKDAKPTLPDENKVANPDRRETKR